MDFLQFFPISQRRQWQAWQQRMIPVWACRVSDVYYKLDHCDENPLYAVFVFLLRNVITSLNYDRKNSEKKRDIN
jgi:hypothetical protein